MPRYLERLRYLRSKSFERDGGLIAGVNLLPTLLPSYLSPAS